MRREAAKTLMHMNIVTDSMGCIYYNDILFSVFKRMLKETLKDSDDPRGIEIVRKAELSTI